MSFTDKFVPAAAATVLVGSLTGCDPTMSPQDTIKRDALLAGPCNTYVQRETVFKQYRRNGPREPYGYVEISYRFPADAQTLMSKDWEDPFKVAKVFGKTLEETDPAKLPKNTILGSYQVTNITNNTSKMVDITLENLAEQAKLINKIAVEPSPSFRR